MDVREQEERGQNSKKNQDAFPERRVKDNREKSASRLGAGRCQGSIHQLAREPPDLNLPKTMGAVGEKTRLQAALKITLRRRGSFGGKLVVAVKVVEQVAA